MLLFFLLRRVRSLLRKGGVLRCASEQPAFVKSPPDSEGYFFNLQPSGHVAFAGSRNSKECAFIQRLPREHLERIVFRKKINKFERRARIRISVLKKLDENTELKEASRILVKDLPSEQQEKAMASISTRTMRSITPRPRTKGRCKSLACLRCEDSSYTPPAFFKKIA